MSNAVLASRKELEAKVRERTEALEYLTKADALTGLLNRRGMSDQLESSINKAQREQHTLGILSLDVDWFKEINDAYGHTTGDAALQAVAKLIRAHIRPYDHAARWGGDEFLVLLAPVNAEQFDSIAKRICEAVNSHQLMTTEKGLVKLSASIGGYLLSREDKLEHLLERADQSLYAAKAAGRNCYHRRLTQ